MTNYDNLGKTLTLEILAHIESLTGVQLQREHVAVERARVATLLNSILTDDQKAAVVQIDTVVWSLLDQVEDGVRFDTYFAEHPAGYVVTAHVVKD